MKSTTNRYKPPRVQKNIEKWALKNKDNGKAPAKKENLFGKKNQSNLLLRNWIALAEIKSTRSA